jgi:hypothetical protein
MGPGLDYEGVTILYLKQIDVRYIDVSVVELRLDELTLTEKKR